MNLFTYGTLIFADIWQCVVGHAAESTPAELSGYRVLRVVDDLFPVMIPGTTDDRASGVIYFDLTDQDLQRLDDYEAYLYERKEVHPVTEDGSSVACQTYLLREQYRCAATDEAWTTNWFVKHAKADYLKRLGI